MISLRIQALYICCSEYKGFTAWSKKRETMGKAFFWRGMKGLRAISIDDHILGEELNLNDSRQPRGAVKGAYATFQGPKSGPIDRSNALCLCGETKLD